MSSASGAIVSRVRHLIGRFGLTAGRQRARRVRGLYSGIWLIGLYYPLLSAWGGHRAHPAWLPDPAARWVGVLSIVAFAVVYLRIFRMRDNRIFRESVMPGQAAASWLGALTALGVVVLLLIGQLGLVLGVYVAVALVMLLPGRLAGTLVVALAGVSETLSHTQLGWQASPTLTVLIVVTAFAMWGVTQLTHRNLQLLEARGENARLAVEEERNRMARDLHDILGHSLTVITVKAELAGRLMDIDPQRARAEVADLERLSRDALVDVRRSVEGYRELSLPGELARAREALRAAEIEGDLPTSAELVPTELRELFGWAVREGVTNVIRHSGASRCSISLTTSAVEIRDDGAGCATASTGNGWGDGPGHGLLGLRERADAVGAILVTRSVEPQGFSLAVMVGARG